MFKGENILWQIAGLFLNSILPRPRRYREHRSRTDRPRSSKKAFVCSDPDLVKFGVTKKVTDLLEAAGFAYALYSEIKPNPTIKNVQDGVAAFQAAGRRTAS